MRMLAALLLAGALLDAQSQRDALAGFEEALKRSPRSVPALRGAAEAAYTLRDAKARDYVARLLALAPDDLAGNAIAGVLAFEAKDCAAAVAHFRRSEPFIAQNAAALMQYGECLAGAERYSEAAPQFEKALRLQPRNAAARYNLALCRYLRRDPRGAIAVLEPLAADSDSLSLYAAAENDVGNVELATRALKRATELYPDEVRNYIDLALICLEHNAQQLATEVLAVGIRNNPRSARLFTMRGAVYAQGGEVERAQADFDEASRLQPDSLYGSVGMSMLMRQTGRADAAVKVLEQKLAQAKDDPVVNFLYADALWREGIEPGQPAFSAAEQALKRAVQLKPDFAQAHAALGKMYRAAHDNATAIRELELATRYNPHDRVALNQLVLVLRAEGRLEAARQAAARLKANLEQDRTDEVNRNRVRVIQGP